MVLLFPERYTLSGISITPEVSFHRSGGSSLALRLRLQFQGRAPTGSTRPSITSLLKYLAVLRKLSRWPQFQPVHTGPADGGIAGRTEDFVFLRPLIQAVGGTQPGPQGAALLHQRSRSLPDTVPHRTCPTHMGLRSSSPQRQRSFRHGFRQWSRLRSTQSAQQKRSPRLSQWKREHRRAFVLDILLRLLPRHIRHILQ